MPIGNISPNLVKLKAFRSYCSSLVCPKNAFALNILNLVIYANTNIIGHKDLKTIDEFPQKHGKLFLNKLGLFSIFCFTIHKFDRQIIRYQVLKRSRLWDHKFNILTPVDRGGYQVVSVLVLYSKQPSSIPTEVDKFSEKFLLLKRTNIYKRG